MSEPPDEQPRHVDLEGESHGQSSTTGTLSVARVLDELRLAIFGLLLSVGLTVGFGVGAATECGWIGAGSGVLSVMLLVLAFRAEGTRNVIAVAMDWAMARR